MSLDAAPKVYWTDTGLALHLAAEPLGAHLENIVLTDLLACAGGVAKRPNILHWRTAGGAEVDFVVELPGRLLPVEVKAATRVRNADARHLRTFLADYPKTAPGALLLYDGDEIFWIERGVPSGPVPNMPIIGTRFAPGAKISCRANPAAKPIPPNTVAPYSTHAITPDAGVSNLDHTIIALLQPVSAPISGFGASATSKASRTSGGTSSPSSSTRTSWP